MEKLKAVKIVTAAQTRLGNAWNYSVHPTAYLDKAMEPVRDDFAYVPTVDGFNWDRIGGAVRRKERIGRKSKEKYLVVFRSQRKPDANIERLEALEEAALEDAKKSKQLIAYKAGPIKDNDLKNVSYCIWRSAKTAYEVSHRAPHAGPEGAIDEATDAYEENGYEVEVYRFLTKRTRKGVRTTLIRLEHNPFAPSKAQAA